MKDDLIISNKRLASRLILGSGKFSNSQLMRKAIIESKTQMVTMALRRIDLANPEDDFINSIEGLNLQFLPNTSGAKNSEEAIRLARLSQRATKNNWIKLEVTPEPKYLLPDGTETLKATEVLLKEGFVVLPYINADFILGKKLEELGCPAIMPLGSPIGSNQGLKTLEQLKIMIKESNIPVIVDAGIGRPSDAALAMEIGAEAVLVNTAIAVSSDPIMCARAFALAVEAGRLGYLAKLATEKNYASASSPLKGLL